MKTLVFDFAGVLLFQKKAVPGKNSMAAVYSQLETRGFQDYFEFNQEVFDFLTPLKGSTQLVIFTNSVHILDEPEVKEKVEPLFDQVFMAQKMHLSKSEPNSYTLLAQNVQANPAEIFFTDDKEANVLAAQAAGWTTHTFTHTALLLTQLQTFLDRSE